MPKFRKYLRAKGIFLFPNNRERVIRKREIKRKQKKSERMSIKEDIIKEFKEI